VVAADQGRLGISSKQAKEKIINIKKSIHIKEKKHEENE
jgi:hypothetical protein